MANLLEIAELAWRQLFPGANDETAISKEEFIATARTEYGYQLWNKIMAEKREEGYLEIPTYLLSEKEMDVVNNEISLVDIKIMRSLPAEVFIQNIGGIRCECKYVKSTLNLSQILCDDDSLPDGDRPFYIVGKKIKFPKGAHANKLPITYANSGEKGLDGIEVDDVIGGIIRRSLIDIYGGKTGREDKTNNSNADL